jgi:membrane protein CcdC involved in cytochrome C biogenesis
MKGLFMKDWLRRFFSTENSINENIVMGVIFAVFLIAVSFVPIVDQEKYYILAGMVAAFFGLGALKR